MNNNQLIEWLKENGGPVIKLNLIKESLIDKESYDINALAQEILQNEKISNVYSFFNQFENFKSKGEPYSLIHGCYENYFEVFMPIFINMGFHAGIHSFDEKTGFMKEVYPFSADYDMQQGAMPFTSIIIMLYLLKAGYFHKDIKEYTLQRLNKIHKITALDKYDFYEEDKANIRQYSKWKDKKILKDMYNPYVGEYPLPIIYDIKLLLYIYEKLDDDKAKQKIDDIARYTLDPRYQQTSGDYGWHWDFQKNTYHASTSGLSLPLYNESELGRRSWDVLDYLDLTSLSPIIKKSSWMQECMAYLEQYKTEQDTYIFPDSFFAPFTYHNSIPSTLFYKMFISKDTLLKLKGNAIKSYAYELYSTFFMIKIKNRLSL